MPPLETGALGDVIYHKIAECLSYNTDTHNDYYYITPSQDGGEEEAVKLKLWGLDMLDALVRQQVNHRKITDSGVFHYLVHMLDEQDAGVREKATECLVQLTNSHFGREFTIKADVVPRFSRLLFDDSVHARIHIYHVLQNLALNTRQGLEQLITYKVCSVLIQKARTEQDFRVKASAIKLITACLNHVQGYRKCMQHGIVASLVSIIQNPRNLDSPVVLRECCACFRTICASSYYYASKAHGQCELTAISSSSMRQQQGKNETVASGAVPLIIALLLHQSAGVRVAASSALVHITNAESGKEAVVTGDKERSGGDNISLLITSLYDQNTYVQCNVLHILTNVCENTKSTLSGEIDGVNTLEKIRELEEMSPDATVRDAATNALKRLQWIP